MKKDARITLRVESQLISLIKGISKQYKISSSGFASMAIQKAVIDSKVEGELKRELKIYHDNVRKRKLCSQLYIIKNMYSRVMDMALSYYFTTGNINMKALNKVIDVFISQFESLDSDVKEDIGIDFKLTVKKLRNKEFLLSQGHNIKMLKYGSKK